MSLASWKREFYRVPANKVSNKNVLRHSLKKWVGLLPKNRVKHNVKLNKFGDLSDKKGGIPFHIDCETCALCCTHRGGCENCPLKNFGSNGIGCGKEYGIFIKKGSVVPMINILKKAFKREKQ